MPSKCGAALELDRCLRACRSGPDSDMKTANSSQVLLLGVGVTAIVVPEPEAPARQAMRD